MDRSARISILILFWFIIVSQQILPTIGGEQHGHGHAQNQEAENPSFAKMVRHTISIWKQSHQRSWSKIKTVIKEMQFHIFPPNLDFRAPDGANSEDRVGGNSPSGNIKNAAQKSFRASKNTVEETAKSAAEVVGESMHKTAGKVKESVSDKKDESEAEL